ncbi:MAG: aspartate carbamoyltransferase catalytic subunit [Dehalococcoidia bacterium]|nr:MAG: aspartate carbamoyltransferase catalytic subunit [Dehalococcoidia bacterium]
MRTIQQEKRISLGSKTETTAIDSVWQHKHILDLDDFTPAEIELVLQTTDAMHEILSRPIKKVPALRGKSLVTLFYEPSTRTRSSFDLAAKNLSADVINLASSTSSVLKGECLVDTLETLEALGSDIIIMRHPYSGAPYVAARHVKAHIINAGDGWHAHPTQALLDLYTIRHHKGKFKGLKVTIIGDIKHSRVARSNIWGLTKMGARITLCCPFTLLPMGLNEPKGQFPEVGVEPDIDIALTGADVVMALRLQLERQQSGLLPSMREYTNFYQLTEERLAKAKADAIVLHPGPVNEDIEISSAVAHGPRSLINQQVTNGVAVRMALLYLLAGGTH